KYHFPSSISVPNHCRDTTSIISGKRPSLFLSLLRSASRRNTVQVNSSPRLPLLTDNQPAKLHPPPAEHHPISLLLLLSSTELYVFFIHEGLLVISFYTLIFFFFLFCLVDSTIVFC
ncbi:hypothetical protein HAX54_045111, partial [Datura stramonium]|nr:hypothetical protein [Datura stramonium]